MQPGEVHALVGENGAGKSTLMKVLSGAEVPDAGTLELDGRPYSPRGPVDARRRGVVMIYQELAVCPDLTVEANIMLGQERANRGILNGSTNRSVAASGAPGLGHPEIDLGRRSPRSPRPRGRSSRSPARSSRRPRCSCSTNRPARLPREDVRRLFDLIGRLKATGMTIVYISHFLEEIEAVADRFTVLRDGMAVGSGMVGEVPRERIIEMMVGRAVEEQYPHTPHAIGEPVLELTDLCGDPLPTMRASPCAAARSSASPGSSGPGGRNCSERCTASIRCAADGAGSAHPWTQERRRPSGSGRASACSARTARTRGWRSRCPSPTTSPSAGLGRGFLSRSRLKEGASAVLQRLGVKYRDSAQPVGELSGGNQQKVALGRLFHQGADILLLDEPTKGVDVGSKAEIYRQIGAAAAGGKAVLVVSSYLPELFGVCDTLAVMCRGKLTAPRSIAEWTPETVIAAATTAS